MNQVHIKIKKEALNLIVRGFFFLSCKLRACYKILRIDFQRFKVLTMELKLNLELNELFILTPGFFKYLEFWKHHLIILMGHTDRLQNKIKYYNML